MLIKKYVLSQTSCSFPSRNVAAAARSAGKGQGNELKFAGRQGVWRPGSWGLAAPPEAARDSVPKHPLRFGRKAPAPCPIGCSFLAEFESEWRGAAQINQPRGGQAAPRSQPLSQGGEGGWGGRAPLGGVTPGVYIVRRKHDFVADEQTPKEETSRRKRKGKKERGEGG